MRNGQPKASGILGLMLVRCSWWGSAGADQGCQHGLDRRVLVHDRYLLDIASERLDCRHGLEDWAGWIVHQAVESQQSDKKDCTNLPQVLTTEELGFRFGR